MARIRVSVYGARALGAEESVPLIRKAAARAFFHFGLRFDAAVDVRLVDAQGIHAINQAHRGVDRPTDVLSFPLLDFTEGAPRFDTKREARLTGGTVLLGDIVLCTAIAARQANEYGHSFARECAYLTVHSVLHLLGFDHETEPDKALMRQHEEQVMAVLGLTRP